MPVGFLCSMFRSQRNVLLFKMGVLNSAKLPSSTRRPSFHPEPLWTRRGPFHRAYSQGRLSRQKCAVFMAIWTEYGNVVAIVLLTHNRKSWCQVGFVCTWLQFSSVQFQLDFALHPRQWAVGRHKLWELMQAREVVEGRTMSGMI